MEAIKNKERLVIHLTVEELTEIVGQAALKSAPAEAKEMATEQELPPPSETL